MKSRILLLALAGLCLGAGASLVATPKRLTIVDEVILDENGRVLQLRGGNLKGADATDAADLKNNLKMNFARLPIEWKSDTRDPDNPSGLKPAYLTQIDGWIQALVAQGIWVVLEMRVDDTTAKDPDLYSTTGTLFGEFKKTWVYLAGLYKGTDYIAGYGLLAEPSASAFDADPWDTLTGFQLALMDKISEGTGTGGAGDTWTPFFVGPDFNYDTMQYRYDGYYTALAAYRGRLVYEVNTLMPKPWIQDGTTPAGAPMAYPQLPAPGDFTFLITPLPGELDDDGNLLEVPRDYEKIFRRRRVEAANFPQQLNQPFLTWYLQWAVDFSVRNAVPVYLDQFGADVSATGQLPYEHDLLEVAERAGLPWTRWGYTAGTAGRRIDASQAVRDFYTTVGAQAADGQLMAWQADTTGLVRIEAVDYGQTVAGPQHTWRYSGATGALGAGAVRALPDNGVSKGAANAPRLDFRVQFAQSGTHYVWLRMKYGTATDGLWIGLDGTALSQKVASPTSTTWTWVRTLSNDTLYARVTVPTAGFHTFNVWMNRAGAALDDIILTPSSTWTPPGTLPAYSTRVIDAPLP